MAIVMRVSARTLGLALLFLPLAGCGVFLASRPTPASVPTWPPMQVTADQVAQAMQEDHFYEDYGQSSLFIHGTVSAVSAQNNDAIVELASSIPTKVRCDLGHQAPAVHVGDPITVQAADPETDAIREPSAVLIKNCRLSRAR
jgi:hypothetical protein